MKRALVAVALVATTTPAFANDPRFVEQPYNAGQIVRIEGRANVQATIRFGQEELIENVAIGDSNAWQVTPNKRANLLFVKPLAAKSATNMTVVTDKHVYLFDLIANPASQNPLYMMSFDHPKTEEEVRRTDAVDSHSVEQPNKLEVAAASDAYAIVDPARLNFAWAGSGDKRLLPARIYDDGESTFLTWASRSTVPAILIKDRDGTEGPVNFAVRGDLIVIDGVPRKIILRSGRQLATIDNHGPERQPAALAHLDEVKK